MVRNYNTGSTSRWHTSYLRFDLSGVSDVTDLSEADLKLTMASSEDDGYTIKLWGLVDSLAPAGPESPRAPQQNHCPKPLPLGSTAWNRVFYQLISKFHTRCLFV